MARSRAWLWTMMPCVLATPLACTTGVDNPGFTSFAGPQGPSPADPGSSGDTTLDDTEGATTTVAATSRGESADDTAATTRGATSTGPGSTTDPDACDPPCGADQMCVLGSCEPIEAPTTGPAVCNDVPGNYQLCLGPGNEVDTSDCDDPAATCLTGGDPVITGVCAVTGCTEACDCPEAPITGTAEVACGDITADGTNFCYLDCAGGRSCPTGMLCFGDTACLWPGEGADGVPYGDCLNGGPSTCGLEGTCLSDDPDAATVSVCTADCANAGDCDASPGGTAPVTCEDVTGDGLGECFLDCSFGSCPAGMTCFSGFICMWN